MRNHSTDASRRLDQQNSMLCIGRRHRSSNPRRRRPVDEHIDMHSLTGKRTGRARHRHAEDPEELPSCSHVTRPAATSLLLMPRIISATASGFVANLRASVPRMSPER